MRRLLVILFFLTFLGSINAQDPLNRVDSATTHQFRCGTISDSRSSLTAEIGGNGGVYSFNYQRRIAYLGQARLFWSAGLSVLPRSVLIIDFPLSVNWQRGFAGSRSNLILGTGQTLIISNTKGGYVRGTFRAAWRYNFRGQRAFMEFGYTPFYSYIYNFQWDNWVSASFGWNLHSRKS